MKSKHLTVKSVIFDAKPESPKRFRNILANSGDIMESGEVRDLNSLYVMSRDAELVKVSDLNHDPDKQSETYSVKAMADHGEAGLFGEPIPTIEKQFGSCKVWLEADGLHARMYFADNDDIANHAWAISDEASYSVGIDWFPDGYQGVGYEITEPIGILREISMVTTGNDPRAKTIDSKELAEAQGRAKSADKTTLTGRKKMSETIDELTPDERKALGDEINSVLEKFTADVPEDETEPTARGNNESADAADSNEAEATKDEAEKKTDSLHMPVIVIKDKAPKQKFTVEKTGDSWLTSKAGHIAFADALRKAGRFGGYFDSLWRQELSKHMSLDGITGLPTPAAIDRIFEDAMEKSDGIISHFNHVATRSLLVNLFSATTAGTSDRAAGHKKGDTKQDQALTDNTRTVLNKMIYKKLDLDAMELYENPELLDFRARELVDAIIVEIERSAIIGDGRSAPSGSEADLRTFDGTRGFFSIKADAAAGSGIGQQLADTVARTNGDGLNLYDLVVAARGLIKTEGAQYLVAKSAAITAMLQAKVSNAYVVAPGSRVEDILRVDGAYTPAWMDTDTANDAYLIVDGAYATTGDSNITTRAEFDTSKNTDILLDETPRGGSLTKFKSAVAIAVEPGE